MQIKKIDEKKHKTNLIQKKNKTTEIHTKKIKKIKNRRER